MRFFEAVFTILLVKNVELYRRKSSTESWISHSSDLTYISEKDANETLKNFNILDGYLLDENDTAIDQHLPDINGSISKSLWAYETPLYKWQTQDIFKWWDLARLPHDEILKLHKNGELPSIFNEYCYFEMKKMGLLDEKNQLDMVHIKAFCNPQFIKQCIEGKKAPGRYDHDSEEMFICILEYIVKNKHSIYLDKYFHSYV